MNDRQQLQGIFRTFVEGEGWLYTVRWSVADAADAQKRCRELAARFKRPASVRIEDWNFPKSDADGFFFQCDARGAVVES